MRLSLRMPVACVARTRLLLLGVIPALLPLGAIACYQWLPPALLKYFFFTKGWVAWTFTEYCIHRWAFHEKQDKRNKQRDLFNHLHHHTHPADMQITPLMRLAAVVVIASGIWSLLAGPVWLAYFTGWLFGLSLYSIMHYLLHQSYASLLFPNIVKQHIWHHCRYHNLCFGVSTTFWDRVFKTLPAEFGNLPERTIRFYYADAALSESSLAKIMLRLNKGKQTRLKVPDFSAT